MSELVEWVRNGGRRNGAARLATRRGGIFWAVVLAAGAGCADRDQVKVELTAHTPAQEGRLYVHVQAQVQGSQSGLRYKWFAVSGECDPQESEWPATIFKFAEGSPRDRVQVEVWRGQVRLAQSGLDLNFRPGLETTGPQSPATDVSIAITRVPPWEHGGAETRADIAGTVRGEFGPECRVVIYARAYESWFIQPASHARHPINDDNSWATWTHTGENYAALLVTPDFSAVPRLDMLPRVGGPVLARTIVEGRRVGPAPAAR